jgi:hypothetical protein
VNYITPNRKEFGGNIQKCVDYAIEKGIPTVYIPKGVYEIEDGILLKNDKYGQVAINITGEPVAYTGQPCTTVIRHYGKKGFALGIQTGKGVNISNLQIVGENKLNYSFEESLKGSFIANGIEDSKYNPHCGISFEPFEANGSTDCKVQNVYIDGFVVGVAVSPNGKSQNGESLVFDRMWVNNAKVGFAFCQSQNRANIVSNLKCWSSVKTVFDTWSYGQGNGELPRVHTANLASVYELFQTNNGWGTGMFRDVKAELIYRLGDAVGGRLPVNFDGCHFDFQVIDNYPENIATGNNLNFNGCVLQYYDYDWKPLNFNCGTFNREPISFTNCYLQNPASFGNGSDWDENFIYNNTLFKNDQKYGSPVFTQKFPDYYGMTKGMKGNEFEMEDWAENADKYYSIGQPVISRHGVIGIVDRMEGKKVYLKNTIKVPDGTQVGNQLPNHA